MFHTKCIVLFAIFYINLPTSFSITSTFKKFRDENGSISTTTDAPLGTGATSLFDGTRSLWEKVKLILNIRKCKRNCSPWKLGLKDLAKCILTKCVKIVSDLYLFNRNRKVVPIKLEENIPKSVFNPNAKVIFLVHGLTSNYRVHWVNHTRDVFIEFHDFNVIAVDWRTKMDKTLTTTTYGMSALVEVYGNIIRKAILNLIRNGWKSSDIYLVGHSMGAHMISCAAKFLRDEDGVLLDRITGLDPAGVIFNIMPKSSHINEKDAKFVDCIFTSSPYIGMKNPVCGANFYPNYYGAPQPGIKHGILDPKRSHKRAPHLYAESALPGHKFYAEHCDLLPIPITVPTHCEHNATALMGYPASPKLRGIFFLKTNGKYPFALDVHETRTDQQKAEKIMQEFE